ncbi:bacterio-opsin activator domain-containing protein [Halobaculum marinum]|uniref:histidine kinase n=1 Tax=Halobaculum marinum TaxID=3031996 RepID=A0ABD5WZ35_9EURY|nr:bacterio-opsin activator domain-containing protein [Halobaculum sp. DT55]
MVFDDNRGGTGENTDAGRVNAPDRETPRGASTGDAGEVTEEMCRALERIDGVVVSVDTEWLITYANEAAAATASVSTSALVGESLWEVVPGANERTFQSALQTAATTGRSVDGVELHMPDGEALVCSVFPSSSGTTVVAREHAGRTPSSALAGDVNLLVEGHFSIDTEWRVVEWNAEMANRTGLAAADIVGTDLRDLFSGDMHRTIGEPFRRALETQESTVVEAYIIGFDYWVEMTVYPYPEGLSVYSTDVTERRIREHELRETNARLDLALDSTNTGIWEWDLDTDTVLWLGPTSRLFDLDPDAFDGTLASFLELVHPDDLESVEAAIEGSLAERGSYRIQHRIRLPSGESRWLEGRGEVQVDAVGAPKRMTGVVFDVSEQKRHEQRIREKESRLRTLVENAPVMLFELDPDGVVTLLDGRGAAALAYEPDEVVGQSVFDLYADHPVVTDAASRAIAGEPHRTVMDLGHAVLDVAYEPIIDDTGHVSQVIGVATDVTALRQKERTLTALNRSSRQLLAADSVDDVAGVVVDATNDVLGLDTAEVLLVDPESNSLTSVDTVGGGDGDGYGPGSKYWRHFVERDPADTVLAEDGEVIIPLGEHGLVVAEAPEGSADCDDSREVIELFAAAANAAFDRATREQSLRHNEAVLRQQSQRLEQLHELNTQIRNVEHVLVMAEDRPAIERGVCERLVDPERFAFAWIGAVEDGAVTPTHWAGTERGYLPAIDRLSDANEPAARAVRTREPVVVDDVAARLDGASWRREALASGYRSVMSVPLVYDDRLFGVLSVCAVDPDTFGPLVRGVLVDLSETVAYAIDAAETKRGFLTDHVVEVAVRSERVRDPLARIARDTGARVRFDGVVSGSGGRRVFFTVDEADAETVVASAEADPCVESVDVVSATDDGGVFELVSAAALFATEVVDRGGVPLSIESHGDETAAVVELPHGADVSAFVELLRRQYDDLTLTARRDREREPVTRESFRAAFESAVTDRQLEVLETAYFCGYFDSPRTMTGSEVATTLSITQPTFTTHLRAAERALLGMIVADQRVESRY